MPTVLNAQTGRETGSAASRRLRRENKIPGVLYGHGMEPLPLAVERRDLRIATSGPAGFNTVLDLTIAGPDGSRVYPAIVKELQRHPVRRTVSHIDFIQVNLDEAITVSVPLRLEGEAVTVTQNNGLVDPAVDSIEVVTTPRHIPDEFVIDVTDLQMDSVIRLADVPMPAGVTPTGDPELAIVTVLVTRAALPEDAAEGEAAEGAEGEAGETGEAGGDAASE
jgi:large subunit ribosomal protein L25